MPSSEHVTSLKSSSFTQTPSRKITLLVLLADTPPPTLKSRHGDYHRVFTSLFQRSLDTLTDSDYELEVKSYDVVNQPIEYPSADDLDAAAGLLITGSGKSGGRIALTAYSS
jgi:hypothetical protein